MARGLDHIVHAVRDLDAAADLYRRLGFTVGARNKHPWGTHNHIIQLSGFFIELLTFAEPEKLGSDGFSTMFGAYNRDFITRGEGFSLLILEIEGCQPRCGNVHGRRHRRVGRAALRTRSKKAGRIVGESRILSGFRRRQQRT